ncbi:hypothetical protein FOL47_010094 [Perkinsus chesapeaki]|uniref:Glycoside hydrolase family 19 catalytic domain-containing protein n=1 Tax=Perkinsus chesapeaki TaxID=330153 RepID=A0A7J6L4U1_PERCH|nr:hypothetical protein FOL47_010094 [Perkinsus chesapeaki]
MLSIATIFCTVIPCVIQGVVVGSPSSCKEHPSIPDEVLAIANRTIRLPGVPSSEVVEQAENCQRVKRVLPKENFTALFTHANQGKGIHDGLRYTYEKFLQAVAKYPYFCNDAAGKADSDSLDDICRTELATLFAHFAQETGERAPPNEDFWLEALWFFEENGCTPTACQYCDADSSKNWFKCRDGVGYWGRGALQLSWNFNYGPFSIAMHGNASVLLDNPGLIIEDWQIFASAIYFYMTPSGLFPSMHDVVTGHWKPNQHDIDQHRIPGFGVTTLIVNGFIECGKGEESYQSKSRMTYYHNFMNYFGVTPEGQDGCAEMKPFDHESASALMKYWDYAKNDEGCFGTTNATAYSVFDDPYNQDEAYCRCVRKEAPY